FRTDGLVAESPEIFIDVGGGKVVGTQPWNVFQPDQFALSGSANSTGNTINISQTDAPASVCQTYRYFNTISYQLPILDGSYRVRLLFSDPYASGPNQDLMDIVANGATLKSNFDVFATAGGANRATSYTFDTSASGGNGLRLDLLQKSGYSTLAGIEIT